jgi:WD40 repeat protein
MVRVWEVPTGKLLHRIADHFGGYAITAFSPDSKTFASSGGDHSIRFWDANTAKEVRPRDAHHGELITASFHPNGRTVTTVGRDNFVRTWDLATGRQLRAFFDDRDTFERVAFSPDGKLLATYSEDSETTRLWELAEGKVLREFPANTRGLAFTADSKQLAASTPDNRLLLWDVKSGTNDKRFADVTVMGAHLAFSADGKTLALLASDMTLQSWDAQTGRKLHQLETPRDEVSFSLATSPDGSQVAVVTPGGGAILYDLVKGRLLYRLHKGGGVRFTNLTGSIIFSPDGRTLAVTGAGNSAAVLWDVATGAERISFSGHRGPLTFVAYSPDGRSLASGSWDTTVLLWDIYGLRDAGARDLTVQELDEAWKDLSGPDAAKGFQATRRLAATPRQVLPELARQLKPVVAVGRQEIARMIKDLDSDSFEVRQKAFDDLERLGELAEEDLRKMLAAELSVEVRRRVEQLLEGIREGPRPAGATREARALEVLEVIGTPEARAIMEKLAGGAPSAGLTRAAKRALARLPQSSPTQR